MTPFLSALIALSIGGLVFFVARGRQSEGGFLSEESQSDLGRSLGSGQTQFSAEALDGEIQPRRLRSLRSLKRARSRSMSEKSRSNSD